MAAIDGRGIDEKDKQAFIELQTRLQSDANALRKVEQQARTAEVERKRAELVLQELSQMPESTNTYKTVGRTFVLMSKDDMQHLPNVVTEDMLSKLEQNQCVARFR